MRRNFLLILFISSFWTSMHAQNWLLYDASILPTETEGMELDLTDLSQDAPGPNFVEEIVDDPDIPGNKIFRYIQSDQMDIGGTVNATRMYRWDIEDEGGNPWTGTAFTMVARLKGLPDWDELGLDRVFDLQYRVTQNEARDELRIHYGDNVLELEKSDAEVDFNMDLTKWHIFRITLDGKTSTVYVDENPVPVFSGEAMEGTGDLYVKIGDGSGDKIGGYLDWFAVDTSGAWSPEQAPLDDRFTGATFDPSKYKIAFLTKENDGMGNLDELPLIQDLRKRGFQVDVTYNNPSEITFPIDFDFSFDALNDYDLVIVGRGVGSGDYTDGPAWGAVEVPILYLTGYVMRSNRLQMINSGSLVRETGDGNTVDPKRVTNVSIVDGPLFTGLDLDMDGEIGYHTWFYEYIAFGADTFEAHHNATLHAALAVNGGPGDDNVYVASWEEGVEPYDGAGYVLAGPRFYFQMGSDDQNTPKIKNFFAFTEESTLLFHNAIKWLLGTEPDGKVIPLSGPVAFWKMDRTSGTTVDDIIGTAHGEILNGNGVTRESCGVNNSINFNGATKPEAVIWVEDNQSLNFDSTHNFTISFITKVDPFSNTAEMCFILKGDNRSDGMHLPNGTGKWYSVATKDQQLRFAVDDNIVKTQLDVNLSEAIFPPNQWNHVVAVRDLEEDSLKLYVNGALVGSIKDDTDLDISTTDLPVVIGNYHSDLRKLNGHLDELAVYDYAFTADNVLSLYEGLNISDDCTVLETISEASNDASLASLVTSAGSLDPAFSPDVTSYKLVLPAGTTEVTLTAMANHPAAVVSGDGLITNVPGTAVINVTAEDGTMRDYTVNISVEGVGNQKVVVDPGFGTIEAAIAEVNDGDTLVLINGELYTPIDPYQINKKLVIIAQEIPELPGLDNMPVIENLFGVAPVFKLNFGGNLHLIGINVDAQAAPNIFDARGTAGESISFSLYVNRCRLWNTTEDIFNDARDGNTDQTMLNSCVVRNSFVYDSGPGHGFYVKNFHGEGERYLFENITFWNIGQQFNWIRHYPDGITRSFVYDHMTGYNLSSSVADDKELFGNSDGPTESALNIDLKNSIFHTQISANEGSLKFDNTSGRHTINIKNNVLYQVAPIFDLGGTINKMNNMEGVDPQFVDPDNGDFTVMNTSLHAAGDDGEIVGALYWHPDFVDDFSDLSTSVQDFLRQKFALKNYPNPFSDVSNLTFELKDATRVEVLIYNLNGELVQKVWEGELPAGSHKVEIDANELNSGTYFYQLRAKGEAVVSKMIKI